MQQTTATMHATIATRTPMTMIGFDLLRLPELFSEVSTVLIGSVSVSVFFSFFADFFIFFDMLFYAFFRAFKHFLSFLLHFQVFFMHVATPLPFFICFLQNTLTASSRHSLPTLSPFLNFGHFFKSFDPTSLKAFFRAFPHFLSFLQFQPFLKHFLMSYLLFFPLQNFLTAASRHFLPFLSPFLYFGHAFWSCLSASSEATISYMGSMPKSSRTVPAQANAKS